MPSYKPFSNISQAALVGMAILVLPIESTALEWSVQPSLTARANVNDNIDLTTAPHNTVWSSSASPRLTLSASSALSTLSGQAQINRIDYSEKSFSSQTNGLLNLTFVRQYERSQLSLAGDLTRDSTQESELIQTGVVTSWAQRTSRSLSPSWVYSMTERDTINFGYDYVDVSYGNTITTSGLLDYTVKSPSITLTHAFTEKNKLNLSLGYSDYQSQNPPSNTTSQYHSTTTSAQLGFSRDLSETLIVTLMAGVHKTDSTVDYLECLSIFLPSCFPVPAESNSSDTGSLFTATLQKGFESSQLTAELSRSLQPTADGGLVQTDRLSGGYSAKLTSTLNTSLNMSYYKTQFPGRVSSNSNNSRYYHISPAISWRITEWWTANTSYTRSVSRSENGAEATGNAINLTLNYNWPKISSSR